MANEEWGPEPVEGGVPLVETIGKVGVIGVAVCAATFLVLAAGSTRTCGAPRSAQLQWQQRQVQIEVAIAAEQGPAGDQQATEQAAHDAIQAQR